MKNPPMKFVIRLNKGLRVDPHIFMNHKVVFSEDALVSEHMKISVKKYRKFLIEQFNGQLTTINSVDKNGQFVKEPVVYFKTRKDAEEALDWVKSSTILIDEHLIGMRTHVSW